MRKIKFHRTLRALIAAVMIIMLMCGSVVYGENGEGEENQPAVTEIISEKKAAEQPEKVKNASETKSDVSADKETKTEVSEKTEKSSVSEQSEGKEKAEKQGKSEASEQTPVTEEKNSANNERKFSEKEGVTSTDVEVTEKAEKSALSASIKCLQGNDIYFGDKVTLKASVKGATGSVTIVWEYRENGKSAWKALGVKGEKYSFTVTEQNAEYEYRVVVTEA